MRPQDGRFRLPEWTTHGLGSEIIGGLVVVLILAIWTWISHGDAARQIWSVTKTPWGSLIGLCCGAALVLIVRRPQRRARPSRGTRVKIRLVSPLHLTSKHTHGVVIQPEVLSTDMDELARPTFMEGVRRLQKYFRDSPHLTPDLIVGINRGGIATSALIGGAEMCSLGMASIAGPWGARKLGSLLVPDLQTPRLDCNVMLVDWTMKTGDSLDVVKSELERLGFDGGKICASVIVLANLASIPKGDGTYDLTPQTFPQRQKNVPPSYGDWLRRIVFVSYLSASIPKPPWASWETLT